MSYNKRRKCVRPHVPSDIGLITCSACELVKGLSYHLVYCPFCETHVCSYCYIDMYDDSVESKCIECLTNYIDQSTKNYRTKSFSMKLQNLLGFVYLPKDLWRIVFDYTYCTNLSCCSI